MAIFQDLQFECEMRAQSEMPGRSKGK